MISTTVEFEVRDIKIPITIHHNDKGIQIEDKLIKCEFLNLPKLAIELTLSKKELIVLKEFIKFIPYKIKAEYTKEYKSNKMFKFYFAIYNMYLVLISKENPRTYLSNYISLLFDNIPIYNFEYNDTIYILTHTIMRYIGFMNTVDLLYHTEIYRLKNESI